MVEEVSGKGGREGGEEIGGFEFFFFFTDYGDPNNHNNRNNHNNHKNYNNHHNKGTNNSLVSSNQKTSTSFRISSKSFKVP